MQLISGTPLGRYEIRSQLGAGGMGEVYPSFDTGLDRMGCDQDSSLQKIAKSAIRTATVI